MESGIVPMGCDAPGPCGAGRRLRVLNETEKPKTCRAVACDVQTRFRASPIQANSRLLRLAAISRFGGQRCGQCRFGYRQVGAISPFECGCTGGLTKPGWPHDHLGNTRPAPACAATDSHTAPNRRKITASLAPPHYRADGGSSASLGGVRSKLRAKYDFQIGARCAVSR